MQVQCRYSVQVLCIGTVYDCKVVTVQVQCLLCTCPYVLCTMEALQFKDTTNSVQSVFCLIQCDFLSNIMIPQRILIFSKEYQIGQEVMCFTIKFPAKTHDQTTDQPSHTKSKKATPTRGYVLLFWYTVCALTFWVKILVGSCVTYLALVNIGLSTLDTLIT